ncbi:MAG: OsmC family protein [Ferruginibacter sp.]|nr:OsmC family protein [Bacteroidota bacterium]MBX2918654.1 OsmC family protein [Ferruginibacter sp.]MCB0708189.1 OsmC family protein [Chitinophagaceae bacterium]MCC7378806.1 OsmC family protein [Chitinophagaceae bacterium]
MTASIIYTGNLRCQCTHNQSGTVIETDAPTDNRGKGEKFSPTDTLCVALATCIITTMGIKATDMGIELAGTSIAVTKHMLSDPRRVGKVDVILTFPATLQLEDKDRMILQRTGDNCPVAKSLHPDMQLNIVYNW